MLTPLPITWSLVMHTRQIMKVLKWDLLRLNAQFLLQLPPRRPLCSQYRTLEIRTPLAWDIKGMGAAGVSPHHGESDFLVGTLLQ